MAVTQVSQATPAGLAQFNDTQIGAVVDAVKASSTVVYSVVVDNSANGGASSYVKLYNVASGGVTVGTTAPDEIIFVPGGAVVTYFLFTGGNPGKTFATALTAACVTTGGTAGVTPPVSAVKITINYV